MMTRTSILEKNVHPPAISAITDDRYLVEDDEYQYGGLLLTLDTSRENSCYIIGVVSAMVAFLLAAIA